MKARRTATSRRYVGVDEHVEAIEADAPAVLVVPAKCSRRTVEPTAHDRRHAELSVAAG
jgi:hypothetical protein